MTTFLKASDHCQTDWNLAKTKYCMGHAESYSKLTYTNTIQNCQLALLARRTRNMQNKESQVRSAVLYFYKHLCYLVHIL